MRKALYLFGVLNDSDVEAIARMGRVRLLPMGEMLIREGERLAHVYLVLEGRMEVSVRQVGTVATLGSGEILGEMSFVDNSPTSASVTALDGVRVLELDRAALEAAFAREPGFGLRFYKAMAVFLAERMRSTITRLGYGKASLDSDELLEDELDEGLLDNVGMAGVRFSHLMQLVSGAAPA
jgi:CRP-like cAMP-binding protein